MRATLDRHGYGFQFAVVRECQRLREGNKSSWWMDATEFRSRRTGFTDIST